MSLREEIEGLHRLQSEQHGVALADYVALDDVLVIVDRHEAAVAPRFCARCYAALPTSSEAIREAKR